jgi:hypothetical protein
LSGDYVDGHRLGIKRNPSVSSTLHPAHRPPAETKRLRAELVALSGGSMSSQWFMPKTITLPSWDSLRATGGRRRCDRGRTTGWMRDCTRLRAAFTMLIASGVSRPRRRRHRMVIAPPTIGRVTIDTGLSVALAGGLDRDARMNAHRGIPTAPRRRA